MKKVLAFVFFVLYSITINAQQTEKITLYNPKANAEADIDSVIQLAKKSKKHVLIQVGGNWCSWCIKLHKFIDENGDLKRLIDMDYVTYKMNYSPENKNEKLLKKYHHPDRFGFPVYLVLDADGNLIHTQDTGLLEEDKGYSKAKLFSFFKSWTTKAVAGN